MQAKDRPFRVLIARASPEAQRTASALAQLAFGTPRQFGLEPVLAPLTALEPLHQGLETLKQTYADYAGLAIATSARAIETLLLHGLADWVKKQRWAVVGARTGDAVLAAEGSLILEPAENAAELINGLNSVPGLPSQPWLYPCASDRRPALEQAFPDLRPVPIYRMTDLDGFAPNIASQLAESPPNVALLYSPRSADLLGRAIESAKLDVPLRAMGWICLSAEVAEQAPKGVPLWVAEKPTEPALLKLLQEVWRASS